MELYGFGVAGTRRVPWPNPMSSLTDVSDSADNNWKVPAKGLLSSLAINDGLHFHTAIQA